MACLEMVNGWWRGHHIETKSICPPLHKLREAQ